MVREEEPADRFPAVKFPSHAVIDIRSLGGAPKDTTGTLFKEGPVRSFGGSTGCGVQEERWSPEGWFPEGFAITVTLRPPVLLSEVATA